MSLFQETVMGARLDDGLYEILCTESGRETLRNVLIETYFTSEIQERLLAQGLINIRAAAYGSNLLERAQKQVEIVGPLPDEETAVRDQGFRRAVVQAYNHRCGLCGVRIVTAEGHTAIVAAHIIPWSISYNDDPRNGLALCYLCHWTFDEGLVSIRNDYQIDISPQLNLAENLPGHIATIEGRSIIGPEEEKYWPFKESLQWHYREVFRRR